MKITVLMENESMIGLEREHGLSLLIESKHCVILLDAGKSKKVTENAYKLNVDLTNADFAVLSHGHYDHTDGFEAVLEECPHLKVFAHEKIRGEYYSMRDGTKRYIGVNQQLLERFKDNFIFVNSSQEIAEGVFLLMHEENDYRAMAEHACLYRKKGDTIELDDFSHEMSLVIREEEGLFVFNSCAHVGVGNVIKEVKHAFKGENIAAFVGGFHFLGREPGKCSYTQEEVIELGKQLVCSGVQRIYTGHCTGEEGILWLREVMKDKVKEMHAGYELT